MSEQLRSEEHQVSGGDLKTRIKELLREGRVRRVVIKNPSGRTILDLPLAVGLVSVTLVPLWTAIAGIGALTARYTIVVEREEPGG